MSNKIKPWQQRKPKHHGQNQQRNKRPADASRPKNEQFQDPRNYFPVRDDWNERLDK